MTGVSKRILFLDIDGVLNISAPYDDVYDNKNNREYLVLDDVPLYQDHVRRLQNLILSVKDIGIVWSTDWRFENREILNDWMNPRLWLENQSWFSSYLIGCTPKKMSSNRFEEIHFWFQENHRRLLRHDSVFEKSMFFKDDFYDIKNYVILDDFLSSGMTWYGDHFFHCDPAEGFTDEKMYSVIDFLKKDDFNYDDLDWRKREDRI